MARTRVIGTQAATAAQQAATAAQQQAAAALAEKQAEFQQREQDRAEAERLREQTGKETNLKNLLNLQSLRQARREGGATRAEQQKDRDAAALENLMASGYLAPNWEKGKSPLEIAARQRLLENARLNPALAVDPNLAAMRAEVAKTGQAAPGQVPAGTAPPRGTPVPATAGGGTAAPAPTGEDAIDRAINQQIMSQMGIGGTDPRLAPTESDLGQAQRAAGVAMARREALAGAGPVHYDPNLQANVRTPAEGGPFVVGAGDPSVAAARGSQFTPITTGRYAGGTEFTKPSEGGMQEFGAPRNAAAARFREEFMARNAMTPFHPAALAIPGEQAGLPAGYKQTYPAAGQGILYNPATGELGEGAARHAVGGEFPGTRVTQEDINRLPAGVPPIDRPPVGSLKAPPPGSPFSTEAGAPAPGTFRAALERFVGPIRFGSHAAYDPTHFDQPNQWTIPPYMRGGAASEPVQHPESQLQFAPANLVPPTGTGPFGHPVPLQAPQSPAAPQSFAQTPPAVGLPPAVRPMPIFQ
jgi:hypothetical protein